MGQRKGGEETTLELQCPEIPLAERESEDPEQEELTGIGNDVDRGDEDVPLLWLAAMVCGAPVAARPSHISV